MKKLKRAAAFLMSFALVVSLVRMGSVKVAATDNAIEQVTVQYQQTMAREVINYVNQLRASESWQWNEDNSERVTVAPMPALTYDYTLEAAAMQRAAELVLCYDHTRPNGEICFTAYTGSWQRAGENIAYGYNALNTAEAVYNAWLEEGEYYNGQGHRRNMQNSDFTAIGMGCVYYDGYVFWAMELGTPGGAFNEFDPGAVNEERTVTVEVIGSGDSSDENEGGSTSGGSEGGNTSSGSEEGNSPSGSEEGNIPDVSGSNQCGTGNNSNVSQGSSSAKNIVDVDWNTVNSSIDTAIQINDSQNVDVLAGDKFEVPTDVLNKLVGTNTTLALHTGNGIAFSVSGSNVATVDSSFKVTMSSSENIPEEAKQQVLKDSFANRVFGIEEKNEFPFIVNVHMNLGEENAGKKAFLYGYDEASGVMRLVGSFIITEDGQAMFGIRHGGAYIAVAADQAVQEIGSAMSYTVAPGDTLYGIATKKGTSLQNLLQANPQIKDSNKIYPGWTINIW